MKQLQNNFTSPEQSKRLLELGLPADSADCYYLREHPDRLCILNDGKTISKLRLQLHMAHTMPCWSAGRLIEIIITCGIGVGAPHELFINKYSLTPSLITNLIRCLERVAALGVNNLGVNNINFSKLED